MPQCVVPEPTPTAVGDLRLDLGEVSARIERRLAVGRWDSLNGTDTETGTGSRRLVVANQEAEEAAAEMATFALGLTGKRRAARRGGRVSRLILHFAAAATLALSAVAGSGCNVFNSTPAGVSVASLPVTAGAQAVLTASAGETAGRFTDLVLLDAGDDTRGWATLVPLNAPAAAGAAGGPTPVLVNRAGSGLDAVGTVYTVPGQPISVGSRDGTTRFLDPLAPAVAQPDALFDGNPAALLDQVTTRWKDDQRFAAATRTMAGQPNLLDAAYNAAAAATAGGTHTYQSGVVLRVEPDSPVLHVIDRALLESGTPTRPEDVVLTAIRPSEQVIYEPGKVVNLRDVAMDRQTVDVEGTQQTVYIVNAALDGARVEPVGNVDLQALLQQRLQRTDADLALQAQELAQANGAVTTPGATATPAAATQQNTGRGYRGPSLVDDFLMFWWLSNLGWYRGPSVIVNNPPFNPNRPTGDKYYTPPTARDAPPASSGGTQSRSTVLQNARSSVSGQAAGTGGGIAATTKAAADSTARTNAATAKAASAAGQVSASSVGRSTASVPRSSSATANRSSGSTSSSSAARLSSSGGGSSSSSSSGSSIGRSSSGFGGGGSTSSS